MYKLLLVTNRQKVKDAFGGIASWAYLGFKEPRVAGTVDEALQTLSKHHVDGVIISLPEMEQRRLIEIMNERPLIPIVLEDETVTSEQVTEDVEQIGLLLNRVHADYSNDRTNTTEMMQMCRHEYFRKLLSGSEKDEEKVLRTLLMMRSKMDPWSPCMFMELTMPEDVGYLQGKWQYGADRLEVAMRNIFGAEKEGMRVLVSVVNDQRMFLIACPMIGEKQPGVEKMQKLIHEHAQAGIEHVREFLCIELHVASEEVRENLLTLTQKGV